MNARAPDGSDEPEAVDQVMLAVLANRGREATVLSADEERLVDDWVAGRLAPEDAARAELLVRQNALAAERVLGRRLQEAANQSPSVPQELTARVLKANAAAKASSSGGWWRSFGRWQWAGIAGAAALASIVALVGVPMWQQPMQHGGSIRVAMATINDRNPLFESSDIRMRGPGPQAPAVDQRFRDVEVPTSILKGLSAAEGREPNIASREIEPYLSPSGDRRPAHVILDSVLKARIDASEDGKRMLVRIYDLEDPRSTDIRPLVGPLPTGRRIYLLTLKP
jgi:hypothetical protein